MNNKKNRNSLLLVAALLVGGALAGVAVHLFSRSGSPGITATGGSKVATNHSRIEENIITNEYDLDEKRRRDIRRFASSVGRECRAFGDIVRSFSPTDRPTGEIPNLLGLVFLTAETQELLGSRTYDTLVAKHSRLQQLHGELVQLQIQNMAAPAQEMLRLQTELRNRELTAAKRAELAARMRDIQSGKQVPQGSSVEFEPKRAELERLSHEYCELVASLKS